MLLGNETVPVRLRRVANARRISLSADVVKREVRISLPIHGSERAALGFAQTKAEWLAARFAAAPEAVMLTNGAEIGFAGEPHQIVHDPAAPRKPVRSNGEIVLGGPPDQLQARLLRWLKSEAKAHYAQDLAEYCAAAGVAAPALAVGDARRRWGSCSSRGSIRLNWRLIMAPEYVRRSVVAHEVAHLVHMNHSASFYALLDSIFEGDRNRADRWLKVQGPGLYLIG